MRGHHRSRRLASAFASPLVAVALVPGASHAQDQRPATIGAPAKWPLPSERERVAERHGATVR